MVSRRKHFRQSSTRAFSSDHAKKRFVIACEGAVTEAEYLDLFNDSSTHHLTVIKGGRKSAPRYVLQKIKNYLKKRPLNKEDEAWIVIDRDSWQDYDLEICAAWVRQSAQHHIAISNPSFEYWLLLHFEDGNNVGSKRECLERLRRYQTGYQKSIQKGLYTDDKITQALMRAARRNKRQKDVWSSVAGTTVNVLIAKLHEKH